MQVLQQCDCINNNHYSLFFFFWQKKLYSYSRFTFMKFKLTPGSHCLFYAARSLPWSVWPLRLVALISPQKSCVSFFPDISRCVHHKGRFHSLFFLAMPLRSCSTNSAHYLLTVALQSDPLIMSLCAPKPPGWRESGGKDVQLFSATGHRVRWSLTTFLLDGLFSPRASSLAKGIIGSPLFKLKQRRMLISGHLPEALRANDFRQRWTFHF